MMKIKSQATYEVASGSYEQVSSMPSLTVPDMSMPLGQMLDRFLSGQPIKAVVQGYHFDDVNDHDDDEVDSERPIDLTDIDDKRREFANLNEQLAARISSGKKSKDVEPTAVNTVKAVDKKPDE